MSEFRVQLEQSSEGEIYLMSDTTHEGSVEAESLNFHDAFMRYVSRWNIGSFIAAPMDGYWWFESENYYGSLIEYECQITSA